MALNPFSYYEATSKPLEKLLRDSKNNIVFQFIYTEKGFTALKFKFTQKQRDIQLKYLEGFTNEQFRKIRLEDKTYMLKFASLSSFIHKLETQDIVIVINVPVRDLTLVNFIKIYKNTKDPIEKQQCQLNYQAYMRKTYVASDFSILKLSTRSIEVVEGYVYQTKPMTEKLLKIKRRPTNDGEFNLFYNKFINNKKIDAKEIPVMALGEKLINKPAGLTSFFLSNNFKLKII